MTSKVVSVPGKLFLLGEYAVLSGGPALLSAVDRRIHVYRQKKPTGYQVIGAKFKDARHLPELVAKTLCEHTELGPSQEQIDSLQVDVSEFYHQEKKLGIGSSAASTVALVKALAPKLELAQQFELAFIAHKALQNGRGSGADVALSTFGGQIVFQSSEIQNELPQITPLSTPLPCALFAVWTGSPAHSVSFIDGVHRTRKLNPRAVDTIYQEIAQSAQRGIKALQSQDESSFLHALKTGDRLMEELGKLCDLPIITDAHRTLRHIAQKSGFIAKPSGAGGGDFSLLAGPLDASLPPPISERFFALQIS